MITKRKASYFILKEIKVMFFTIKNNNLVITEQDLATENNRLGPENYNLI